MEDLTNAETESTTRAIRARPGCCERPVPGFETYVPCNNKAAWRIVWGPNGEETYELVCDECIAPLRGAFGVKVIHPYPEEDNTHVQALMLAEDESPPDKLDQLRNLCSDLRAVETEMENLQTRLDTLAAERHTLRTKAIPDLMMECKVPGISLGEEDGFAPCDVVIEDFVTACIAADWDDERRKRGFACLEAREAGDLIKTRVVYNFPREARAQALEFMRTIEEILPGIAVTAEIKEDVHAQTLGAWLREIVKSGKPLPPLEVIGGIVEKRAELRKPGKRKLSTKRRK
jgi:hypothetical protein